MTVTELIFILSHVKRPSETSVVVVENKPHQGPTPFHEVDRAEIGIDWDNGKVLIYTKQN